MKSTKWLYGSAAALVLVPVLAAAQAPSEPAAGTSKPGPVMAAVITDAGQAEKKLIALAEAFPAEAFGWRPSEGVRSASEVVMHLATDNYFIPTYAGVAPPEESGIKAGDFQSAQAFERRTVTKEEAVAALRTSFEHLNQAMAAASDESLAEPTKLFGQETTKAGVWVLAVTHLHEHLGQLIAYARSNEVVPPWSR